MVTTLNNPTLFAKRDNAGASGQFRIQALRNGKVVRDTGFMKNQVVNNTDHGVQLLIAQMAGDTTNPIDIDSLSIGTGQSARTTAMTDLETPVTTDIPYSTRQASGNEWQGDFFILDAELPDDTYYELGIYMHGQLYATALIDGGFSKVSGEDLLVTYKTAITPQ